MILLIFFFYPYDHARVARLSGSDFASEMRLEISPNTRLHATLGKRYLPARTLLALKLSLTVNTLSYY